MRITIKCFFAIQKFYNMRVSSVLGCKHSTSVCRPPILWDIISRYRYYSSGLRRSDTPQRYLDLSTFPCDKIRNFGIVAHVDHGKSTLADRILEITGVVDKNHEHQLLDKLKVERERGITVKAQTCSMVYKGTLLNLIDTPGHVDFSFEVSRSVSVVDGILLLVAANQGVQAQTIANFWLASKAGITIIPVINKIDLKNANISQVEEQMRRLFNFKSSDILHVSAKNGENVLCLLDSILERIPAPKADSSLPFRSFIFDSCFEEYRGAIAYINVKEGQVRRGQKIRSFHGKHEYEVSEVGVMHPNMVAVEALFAGQVGYLIANMKTVKEATVGETLFDPKQKDMIVPVPALKTVKPTVYAGLFPVDPADYDELRQALERLSLNDPSVSIVNDSSLALGLGWRVGFLGVLHMEVFSARLDQEYNASVILTYPSVEYRAVIIDNENVRRKRYGGKTEVVISKPSDFPDVVDVSKFLEPVVEVSVIIPNEYFGAVNTLCMGCRGVHEDTISIDDSRLMVKWQIPLAEVVVSFFESLKRISSGYASFDYEHCGYREVELSKLVITVNNTVIDEFSEVLPASMLKERAKLLVTRLKQEISRQQFSIAIKATSGKSTKVIAQATVPPMKRDFTQLLKGNFGGGGMERLKKKLSHQKEGKERLRRIGRIQFSKDIFLNVLRK
ncbi:hypothetical protein AB6A40_004499 [Gnathostoma spinigerum]|uniref:Translation factor GUF1 homolog, mitochondrial n=1 Tax=Gnathostoma spinigerum TaxID=75299 RepID=A0ABD6END7_9BILA